MSVYRRPVQAVSFVRRAMLLATLILTGGVLIPAARADDRPTTIQGLDRGHRLLVEYGFQSSALIDRDVTDSANWAASHFTTLQFTDHQTSTGGGAAGRVADLIQFPAAQWGRLTWDGETHPGVVTTLEQPYLSRLTMMQYLDERSVTNTTEIANAKSTLASWRTHYPDAIGYTNQYGGQVTDSTLQSFMNQVEPDMLFFDRYVFAGSATASGASTERATLYFHMQRFRTAGLLGHDLTGTRPIPYGMYTQCTDIPGGSVYHASGSETYLQYFGAMAFGFKALAAFTYMRPTGIDGLAHSLFNNANNLGTTANGQPYDTDPRPLFAHVAEANRQALNLGPSLVQLYSTKVCVQRGYRSDGAASSKASNVDDWAAGADPYITAISAVNLGSLNGGYRGDVVLGYFKPLLQGFAGADDLYFMVVNGLTALNADPGAVSQTITLTFDFGATGVTGLLRLNRDTGHLERVALQSVGGSVYQLALTLEGGAGDLFKLDTGNGFVGQTGGYHTASSHWTLMR